MTTRPPTTSPDPLVERLREDRHGWLCSATDDERRLTCDCAVPEAIARIEADSELLRLADEMASEAVSQKDPYECARAARAYLAARREESSKR